MQGAVTLRRGNSKTGRKCKFHIENSADDLPYLDQRGRDDRAAHYNGDINPTGLLLLD